MVKRRFVPIQFVILLTIVGCGSSHEGSGGPTTTTRPSAGDWADRLDGSVLDAPSGTSEVRAKEDGSAIAYLSAFDGQLIVFDHAGQRRIAMRGRRIESFDWDPAVGCGWLVVTREGDTRTAIERLGCHDTDGEKLVDLPPNRETAGLASIDDDLAIIAIQSGGSSTPTSLARVDLKTGNLLPLPVDDPAAIDTHPVAIDDSSVVFVRRHDGQPGVRIGRLHLDTETTDWLTAPDRVSLDPFVVGGTTPVVLYDSYAPGVDGGRSCWLLKLDGSVPLDLMTSGDGQPAVVGRSAIFQHIEGAKITLVVRTLPSE
jgi:hypothetical protein